MSSATGELVNLDVGRSRLQGPKERNAGFEVKVHNNIYAILLDREQYGQPAPSTPLPSLCLLFKVSHKSSTGLQLTKMPMHSGRPAGIVKVRREDDRCPSCKRLTFGARERTSSADRKIASFGSVQGRADSGHDAWKKPKSRDIDDQEDGAAVRQLAMINQREEKDGKTGKTAEVST